MNPKRKEETKELLERSDKLTDQIENLYNDLTVTAIAINKEIQKFNDARVKLLFAKQTLLRLLRGI
jgi:hypothetical protein